MVWSLNLALTVVLSPTMRSGRFWCCAARVVARANLTSICLTGMRSRGLTLMARESLRSRGLALICRTRIRLCDLFKFPLNFVLPHLTSHDGLHSTCARSLRGRGLCTEIPLDLALASVDNDVQHHAFELANALPFECFRSRELTLICCESMRVTRFGQFGRSSVRSSYVVDGALDSVLEAVVMALMIA